MNLAPIELNLYNEQDEVVDTLSRSRIPSYLLDTAIELQKQVNEDSKNADLLFDFIIEFYGGKRKDGLTITRDELKHQTDLMECLSIVRSVLARASGLALEFAGQANINPTMPPSPRKRSTARANGS
ncbi:MAG: hypothetical protein ABI904_23220 [Chloroflexota bacterium]